MLPSYFIKERGQLEEIRRTRAQSVFLSGGIACRVLGKYIVYVDPTDIGITPHLCLDGFWESWITIALARELKQGFFCLDIGANHGYYSLIMADAVGPTGRVLAVEPNSALALLTARTIEVNGFSGRASIAQVAVSDNHMAEVEFIVPLRRSLLARLGESAGQEERLIIVEKTTVDHLTASWPRVDLVKIDAEGTEDRVWDGMTETLQRNPSILIMLEFTPSRYRDSKRFVEAICAKGFTPKYVDEVGGVRPISPRELLSASQPNSWWMLYLQRNSRE